MKKVAIGHIIILCLSMLMLIITLLGGFSSPKSVSDYQTIAFFSKFVALSIVCSLSLYFVFALLTNEEHESFTYISLVVTIIYFLLSLFSGSSQIMSSICNFFGNVLVVLTIDMAIFSVKTQSTFHDNYKKILALVTSIVYLMCTFTKADVASNIMNNVLFAGLFGSSEETSLISNFLLVLSCLCFLGVLLNPVIAYLTSNSSFVPSSINQKAFEMFQQQKNVQGLVNQAAAPIAASQPINTSNQVSSPLPNQVVPNVEQPQVQVISNQEPPKQQEVCNLNAQNVSPQLAFLLQQDNQNNSK